MFLQREMHSFRALTLRSSRLGQSRVPRVFHEQLRYAASSAALHKRGAIWEILASASDAQPLKDAAKFYGASPDRTTIWTYRDLYSHVSALSSGLQDLGYSIGDKIVVWMPAGAPEYVATILAASNLGLTVITCQPPKDPNDVSVATAASAIEKHNAKALFFSHEYQVAGDGPEDGIVASMHSVVNAIAPGMAVEDARGLSGFSPLTGKPCSSSRFPSLEHIVHTGNSHVRGAISFKSLLSYNNRFSESANAISSARILSAETNDSMSGEDLLEKADALGNKLQLTNDHNVKNGKVVIPPSAAPSSVAGIVAAVLYESMWISPGVTEKGEKLDSVISNENAVLMQ